MKFRQIEFIELFILIWSFVKIVPYYMIYSYGLLTLVS